MYIYSVTLILTSPLFSKKKCGLKIKKNKEVVQCVATWHNVNNEVKNDVHVA